MGYRLHAATKYEIKYDSGNFNYLTEEMNRLIAALCSSVWYNDVLVDSSDSLEVDKDEWENAIKTLESEYTDAMLPTTLLDEGYGVSDIVKVFKSILSEADTTDGYIHLEWF